MTPELVTTLITTLFGLGGVLIGGLITHFTQQSANRHNREVTLQAVMKSTIAPMKYEWVKDLRECVAQVLVSLQEGSTIDNTERQLNLMRLELMLGTKNEALVNMLNDCQRKMQDAGDDPGRKLEATEQFNKCAEACKAFAKREWDRIQDPEQC